VETSLAVHRAAKGLVLLLLTGVVGACGSSDESDSATASKAAAKPAASSVPTVATPAEKRKYERQVARVVAKVTLKNERAGGRDGLDSYREAARFYAGVIRNFRQAALDMGDITPPREITADHDVISRFFWELARSRRLQMMVEAARTRDDHLAEEAERLPLLTHGMEVEMRHTRKRLAAKGYKVFERTQQDA
jgi:hypothetical protein